jgi:hypothetical protein
MWAYSAHGKIGVMSVKNKEGSATSAAPQDDGEVIAVRVVKTERPVAVAIEPEVLKVIEPEGVPPVVTTEAAEPAEKAEPVVDAPRRSKARKTARNIAISAFAMLVLLAGAGVAYTYFFGPSASEAVTPKAAAEVQPLPKPAVPADNAPEGVAIGAFTTPVKPSDNASIQVHTQPTSTCTIAVTYNSVVATDSGLVGKTADDYGTVGWSWTVPTAAPEGKWPVKVTCTYHGRSGVYQAELEISKTAQS